MSGPPRPPSYFLGEWSARLTRDENLSLGALHDAIAEAIRRAQKVPGSIDRRCMALCVERLEEAEHWALQARRNEFDLRAEAESQQAFSGLVGKPE